MERTTIPTKTVLTITRQTTHQPPIFLQQPTALHNNTSVASADFGFIPERRRRAHAHPLRRKRLTTTNPSSPRRPCRANRAIVQLFLHDHRRLSATTSPAHHIGRYWFQSRNTSSRPSLPSCLTFDVGCWILRYNTSCHALYRHGPTIISAK